MRMPLVSPMPIKTLLAAAILSFGGMLHAAPSLVNAGPGIEALAASMASGQSSSAAITRRYLDRIQRLNHRGPKLHAVIAVMPDAMQQARVLDAERKAGRVLGPLHGIPVLVKDNIEVAGPVPTTAGSLALSRNITDRDAPLVARLRQAGAVILGKTNLSEWANIRSANSSSGWSAVGGLARNPHDLIRSACGSSSGSGVAMAAGLAAATVGTETDGSIVCPSSMNGIVGFKPTVGMISRTHVIPISQTQDTPGPMAGSVRDAALLLAAMAGADPLDPATREADRHKPELLKMLATHPGSTLRGKRIGVLRDRLGDKPEPLVLIERALQVLKREGAEIIDISDSMGGTGEAETLGEAEFEVLLVELKAGMNQYLAGSPARIAVRSLADLIAFNNKEPRETAWFGQDYFVKAEAKKGLDDPGYLAARDKARNMAGPQGIDRLLARDKLDALIGITTGPAWTIDLINGDHFSGPSASQLPAVAGYPHLTVPMGKVHGLPVGLSFIGKAWSDAHILALGAAYERSR
jgi:amidase